MKQKLTLILGIIFLAGATLNSFAAFIVPSHGIENPVSPGSTVSSAFSEFKSLSRKERKSRVKEVKSKGENEWIEKLYVFKKMFKDLYATDKRYLL